MGKSSERGRNRELRSSALWGKGGRGLIVSAVAVLALGAPLAATAAPGPGKGKGPSPSNRSGTFVSSDLQAKAKAHPNDLVNVIIQSSYGTTDARSKAKGLGQLMKLGRNLDLVGGVSVQLPAKLIDKLGKLPGLSITPDAPVKIDGRIGYSSKQTWPHRNGDARLWDPSVKDATIAVVDSGIDPSRADFGLGSRVVANVNLSRLSTNTVGGDGRGHGTFVAGVAAGSAPNYAGAAPTADIVALDVMDDQGMALTSDVIAACNWILQNRDTYKIKVANFSLHSTYPSNFGHDPLDVAVEKLWFSGITVVAAAGNYGNMDGTPSGVKYAPGNDPFVITVGAVDLGKGLRPQDGMAPWSAYGSTYDGFWKPEISAVGRYIVGPVPPSATLTSERPDDVVAPGYMQLSGTSFSAPVVAGTASALLARHPDWTPDQVKGALMASAKRIPKALPYQGGVGEINAVAALRTAAPPNPNLGLDRFVVADPAGGSIPVFDAVSWYDAAMGDISWDSISWDSISWDSISWDSISWDSISWDSVSWADVSWSDVSWADVSWADSAKEDAANEDTNVGGVPLTTDDAQAIADDPSLNLDPSLTDPQVIELAATPTTTSP